MNSRVKIENKEKPSGKYWKSQNKIKILHKSDVNAPQNIGNPLAHAGLKRKGNITGRGLISKQCFDSQIIFGSDENYMPMNTQRIDYSKLVI